MNLATIRALLAEPNDDARGMYTEFCRTSEVSFEEACDGREALAKALARSFDVIVTETRLPGIGGHDLIGLLRHDASTRRTPILVVTSDGSPSNIERLRGAGADAVLVKPCLPHVLVLEIRRLLERSTAMYWHTHDPEPRIVPEPIPHRALSRQFSRRETTTPPTAPPDLICPTCDQPLMYQRTHIGGVNYRQTERWDYFECPFGCGTFQYRQRNRKLRKVS